MPAAKMYCPSCGWSDIRPSMRRGVVDWVLSRLDLTPFRCRSCRQRFFRFRHSWAMFVVPIMVCLVLGICVVGGIYSKTWIKTAKRSITGSLVNDKGASTQPIKSNYPR